jgi:hypothetical protein
VVDVRAHHVDIMDPRFHWGPHIDMWHEHAGLYHRRCLLQCDGCKWYAPRCGRDFAKCMPAVDRAREQLHTVYACSACGIDCAQ